MKTALIILLVSIGISINAALIEESSTLVKIPGTRLYTGLFYKIYMKKFPQGTITYTDTQITSKGAHFLQVSLNPGDSPFYQDGGKWYNATQFIFSPSEVDGYYVLKLKTMPDGLIAVINDKVTDTVYNHLTIVTDPELIKKYSVNGSERDKALFKVVPTDGMYNQLKVKFNPDGYVTWTDKKYQDISHYLQAADPHVNYSQGSKWYDDTLLMFQHITVGICSKV